VSTNYWTNLLHAASTDLLKNESLREGFNTRHYAPRELRRYIWRNQAIAFTTKNVWFGFRSSHGQLSVIGLLRVADYTRASDADGRKRNHTD